jgi:hypothetical protein
MKVFTLRLKLFNWWKKVGHPKENGGDRMSTYEVLILLATYGLLLVGVFGFILSAVTLTKKK